METAKVLVEKARETEPNPWREKRDLLKGPLPIARPMCNPLVVRLTQVFTAWLGLVLGLIFMADAFPAHSAAAMGLEGFQLSENSSAVFEESSSPQADEPCSLDPTHLCPCHLAHALDCSGALSYSPVSPSQSRTEWINPEITVSSAFMATAKRPPRRA